MAPRTSTPFNPNNHQVLTPLTHSHTSRRKRSHLDEASTLAVVVQGVETTGRNVHLGEKQLKEARAPAIKFVKEKMKQGDGVLLDHVQQGLLPTSTKHVTKIHLLRLCAWHKFSLDPYLGETVADCKSDLQRETQKEQEMKQLCLGLACELQQVLDSCPSLCPNPAGHRSFLNEVWQELGFLPPSSLITPSPLPTPSLPHQSFPSTSTLPLPTPALPSLSTSLLSPPLPPLLDSFSESPAFPSFPDLPVPPLFYGN